jgi:DNA-binding transcriptional LysR family regulator
MDLEARPLRYFIAVAEEKSFSRAAAKLNVSQPSLSAQVRELERRLGFDLFVRTSRRVELTREGDLFLGEAVRMVAAARWMNRAAREIAANELRIGAPLYTLHVPERVALIEGFIRGHPEAAVQVSNAGPRRQFMDLRRGAVDVAVIIGQTPEASVRRYLGERSQIDAEMTLNFETLTVRAKPVEILLPEESPLAARAVVPISALAGVRVAVLDRRNGGSLTDALVPPLAAARAELVTPPESNAVAVERYARLLRIAAVSLGWSSEDPAGPGTGMVLRPLDGLGVVTRLALVRRQGEPRPLARTFWEYARARAADYPPRAEAS